MSNPSFAVVGIGASAGGVEALTALFRRMPPQPGAAFIVVTHLAPEAIFPVADVLSARGIPFAFLTGYGRESLPAGFLASGCILSKPFQANTLVATVRGMCT